MYIVRTRPRHTALPKTDPQFWANRPRNEVLPFRDSTVVRDHLFSWFRGWIAGSIRKNMFCRIRFCDQNYRSKKAVAVSCSPVMTEFRLSRFVLLFLERRPGMSDVSLLSGTSELSFDSTCLFSVLFFCSFFSFCLVFFFFFANWPFSWHFFSQKIPQYFKLRNRLFL